MKDRGCFLRYLFVPGMEMSEIVRKSKSLNTFLSLISFYFFWF